jgi:hypothetical protein
MLWWKLMLKIFFLAAGVYLLVNEIPRLQSGTANAMTFVYAALGVLLIVYNVGSVLKMFRP